MGSRECQPAAQPHSLRSNPPKHDPLLAGLSPHQNRTIPPLRYSWVYALKRDFPHLTFYLNGGIDGYRHAESVLAAGLEGHGVGGVMIGRAAYYYPWDCLADVDRAVYGCENNAAASRREVFPPPKASNPFIAREAILSFVDSPPNHSQYGPLGSPRGS